jgi:hypothetical protein
VVDIATTAADFADVVRQPGKYRLDALDDGRRALQGVPPAYVMVGGAAIRTDGGGAGQGVGQGDLALRTLAEVLVKQSAQVGSLIGACTKLVAGVDAAGVSRREPPPPSAPAPAPAPTPAEARRNGVRDDEDGDDDEDQGDGDEDQGDGDQDQGDGDQDSDGGDDQADPDGESVEARPRDPDWFDRAMTFCATCRPRTCGCSARSARTWSRTGSRKS